MQCTCCQLCRTLIYQCTDDNGFILCHRELAFDTSVSRLTERDGHRRLDYATGNTGAVTQRKESRRALGPKAVAAL